MKKNFNLQLIALISSISFFSVISSTDSQTKRNLNKKFVHFYVNFDENRAPLTQNSIFDPIDDFFRKSDVLQSCSSSIFRYKYVYLKIFDRGEKNLYPCISKFPMKIVGFY